MPLTVPTQYIHLQPTCAPLSLTPSPLLSARFHGRSPTGSEPAPRCIKSSPRKRTRMTRIKRIFTDFPISANPRHPRNPCSIVASLQFDQNMRSSVSICGSFFAEAPQINRHLFINNRRVKYSSAPGTRIRFSCALPETDPDPLSERHAALVVKALYSEFYSERIDSDRLTADEIRVVEESIKTRGVKNDLEGS